MKISILIIIALISKVTITYEIIGRIYISKVSTSEIIMKRNIDDLMLQLHYQSYLYTSTLKMVQSIRLKQNILLRKDK